MSSFRSLGHVWPGVCARCWNLARPSQAQVRLFLFLFITCAGIQLAVPDEPIVITSFRLDADNAYLEWSGGRPPYRVQACTDPDFNWFDVSEYVLTNSYTSPYSTLGRPEEIPFTFFRIRSAIDVLAPSPPSGLSIAARRCDMLVLLWEPAVDADDSSGIASYRIYRDNVRIGEVSSPGTFYMDKDARHDSTFAYTVTSVDRVGNESVPSDFLFVDSTPCVDQNGEPGGVTVLWDPDPGVAGYLVYWGKSPGERRWVMDAMNADSLLIPGLEPGVAYFFVVVSYDRDGGQSDFSAEVAVITPAVQVVHP